MMLCCLKGIDCDSLKDLRNCNKGLEHGVNSTVIILFHIPVKILERITVLDQKPIFHCSDYTPIAFLATCLICIYCWERGKLHFFFLWGEKKDICLFAFNNFPLNIETSKFPTSGCMVTSHISDTLLSSKYVPVCF